MKLSVAIISFNEEDNIGRTLTAVHDLADEIIVVDSNSTDKTEEIARSYSKVKFFSEAFKGDGPQKQSAIDKCSGEWVLVVDADEEISKELNQKIRKLVFENQAKFKVYDIRLVSVINKKIIKFGGWSDVTKRILFKRDTGYIKPVKVHGSWQTTEKVGKINEHIYHYLYRNVHHQIEKMNIYTTEQAKINYDAGKRIWLVKVLFLPFFHFFKMYVLRLGFLDGLMGFYLAVVNYFYAFLKYYKLYNLQKNGRT